MSEDTADTASVRKNNVMRWLILIGITMQAICLLTGAAMAETRWTPAVEARASHDDNIEFSRTDTKDDFIYSVEPQLAFDYLKELTRFSAVASADVRRYQDNSDLNDEIYKFDLKGNTYLSERLKVEGGYNFIKDTTLDSELQEIGRVFFREDRKSHDVKLAPTYNLTELLSVGLNGRYRNVSYDSATYADYAVWEVSLPVGWLLQTQKDTLLIIPGYSDRDSDVTHSKTYSFKLGWNHETTERLSFKFSAGVRHTELEHIGTNTTDKNWNGVGSLGLTYKYETGYASLDYLHDLRNTASGNQVNVDRLIARLHLNFTERLGMTLYGSYYYTKDESKTSNESSKYFKVGPTFSYNLTENHELFIAYDYSQSDAKNGEPRATRNEALVGIRLSFPI